MKHLTLDEWITIQEGLDAGLSIRTIAKTIDKSASTVMREIEKHKTVLYCWFILKTDPNLQCLYWHLHLQGIYIKSIWIYIHYIVNMVWNTKDIR